MRDQFEEEVKKVRQDMGMQISTLNDTVDILSERVINLEAHGRRLNVIINNVDEVKDENAEEVVRNVMVEKLKIDKEIVNEIKFRDVHRLPSPKTTDSSVRKVRPIIAACIQQHHRNLFMYNAHNLKNSKISIKSDLPRELDQLRNDLLKKRRELIGRGVIVRVVERSYKPQLQLKKGNAWVIYKE